MQHYLEQHRNTRNTQHEDDAHRIPSRQSSAVGLEPVQVEAKSKRNVEMLRYLLEMSRTKSLWIQRL